MLIELHGLYFTCLGVFLSRASSTQENHPLNIEAGGKRGDKITNMSYGRFLSHTGPPKSVEPLNNSEPQNAHSTHAQNTSAHVYVRGPRHPGSYLGRAWDFTTAALLIVSRWALGGVLVAMKILERPIKACVC